MECSVDKSHDITDNVGLVVGVETVRIVGVEPSFTIRHDNDQRQSADKAFDTRELCPREMVVGESVEQVENRKGSFGRFRDDNLERFRPAKYVLIAQVKLCSCHGAISLRTVLEPIKSVHVREVEYPEHACRTFSLRPLEPEYLMVDRKQLVGQSIATKSSVSVH